MTRFQYKSTKKERFGFLPTLLAFAVILLLFVAILNSVTASNAERQEKALIRALDRSISCCYAAEGSYPEDLDYIRAHYGLNYDEDEFFVDYRLQGGNLFPEYTVIRIG